MASRTAFMAALLTTVCLGCSPTARHLRASTPNPYTEPPANAITFWGHACAYVDVGGFGIVTDPVFSDGYAIIRHRLIPAPIWQDYDQTRVILISHAHEDHADPRTLYRFPATAVILAPAPAARFLRSKGLPVRTMRPGDEYPFPGGSIVAVAAHHPGPRHSLKARSDGRALGYVIRSAEGTIYYTGDTEYFGGFAEVGRRYKPDVMLLNLNAHLHSEDALAAISDVKARRVIPIHLGAYDGNSTRVAPRWRDEMIRSLGARVLPLPVGGSISLSELAQGTLER